MRGVVLAERDLERRGASVIISADKEGERKTKRGRSEKAKERHKEKLTSDHWTKRGKQQQRTVPPHKENQQDKQYYYYFFFPCA